MRNNRKNGGGVSVRQGADKSPVAKFLPLIVVAVCIIGVVAYFASKHGNDQEKTGGGNNEPSAAGIPTAEQVPSVATVYLDNSVSMQGYVHGRQYLDALADLMSIYPGTEARLVGDSAAVIKTGSELITKLTTNAIHYVGQSLLNEDMRKIVGDVNASKKPKIAFFVTDAIMCGSDAEIRRTPKYNINHRQELMNEISDVFKGQGMGVSVYRLVGDFSGEYFCYDNQHKAISAPRAFYVIAIGKPGIVANFKAELQKRQKQTIFKLRQKNEIHFIETCPMNQSLTVNAGPNGSVVLAVDKDRTVTYDRSKLKDNKDINFHIGFDAFKNYALSLTDFARNVSVTIDGTPYTAEATADSLRNAIIVKVDCSRLKGASSGSKVRITIPYFTPAWITSPMVSNDDDLRFIQGLADESTFFFSYFINGIKNNGVLPTDDFNIYDCELLLKRK